MCSWDLEAWEKLASIVGDVATAAGIAATIIFAPKQLRQWRDERRSTKRAEVAGEGLVAIIRFTTELSGIRSPFFFSNDAGQEHDDSERLRREREADSLEKMLAERWQAFAATSNQFMEAWEKAQVYLAPDVVALFDAVWKIRAETRAAQRTYLLMMRQGDKSDDVWNRAFTGVEKGLDQDLEKARDDAMRLLRPVAHLAERY